MSRQTVAWFLFTGLVVLNVAVLDNESTIAIANAAFGTAVGSAFAEWLDRKYERESTR